MDTAKSKELVLEQLSKTPIIQVACKKAGVSRATYYRWCNQDDDFKEKAEKAQIEGIKLINDLAESKLVANINEQNMTAIIYWLKNHHSAYKEKLEVTAKSESKPLTEEQQKTIEEALKLSPLQTLNTSSNVKNKSINSKSGNKRPNGKAKRSS